MWQFRGGLRDDSVYVYLSRAVSGIIMVVAPPVFGLNRLVVLQRISIHTATLSRIRVADDNG